MKMTLDEALAIVYVNGHRGIGEPATTEDLTLVVMAEKTINEAYGIIRMRSRHRRKFEG